MPQPPIRHLGREQRDAATIDDLTYDGPDGLPVSAFLVRPATAGTGDASPGPAIVAWHWFDTDAPDGDRTQFVGEAVELAGLGVTSLLPQGRFPWHGPPTGGAADAAAVRAEAARLTAGLDLLAADPLIDAGRLAVVGHDFGGMIAAVAVADRPDVRGLVLVAATPRWGDWFLPFWPIPDDRLAYLAALRPVDPIEVIGRVEGAVLFQFGRRDFFIAAMTGLEFRSAAPTRSELLAYDDEHGMREPEVRADRIAFLRRVLDLAPG